MVSMLNTLVKKTLCNHFTTVYCAATDDVKYYFFSLVNSVVTEMIHCRVQDEMPNHCLNRWSWFNTIIQALVETRNDTSFFAPCATLAKQRTIGKVEINLNREPPVTRMILLPPVRSSLDSASSTLNKMFKAGCLQRWQHYREEWRLRNSSVKSQKIARNTKFQNCRPLKVTATWRDQLPSHLVCNFTLAPGTVTHTSSNAVLVVTKKNWKWSSQ